MCEERTYSSSSGYELACYRGPRLSMLIAMLFGCGTDTIPSTSPSSVATPPSMESAAPYRSPYEVTFGTTVPAPPNVPTPKGIQEEVEDEDEEVEESADVEACHTAAETCFASELAEVECLMTFATCLSETDEVELAACIQGEVNCLSEGKDAATCEALTDACLEALE